VIKIQNVGIGNFIRNPCGRMGENTQGTSVEVLQVASDQGNSFLCYPVTDPKAVPVIVDTTRYQFIPIDQMVQPVTI